MCYQNLNFSFTVFQKKLKQIKTKIGKEKVDLFIVGHYKEKEKKEDKGGGREKAQFLSTVTVAILQLKGNVAQNQKIQFAVRQFISLGWGQLCTQVNPIAFVLSIKSAIFL